MKQYEVFFYKVTEAQREEINTKGWDSPIGAAYLDITASRQLPAFKAVTEFDLYEHATTITVDDIEHVYTLLQNHKKPWTASYPCHTDFPRSFSVGDVIWHKDTDSFYWCAPMGFMEIHNYELIGYLKGKVHA